MTNSSSIERLIGKLIVVEYELNNSIINVVNEFNNHITKTVIIECKKLYFNNKKLYFK